MQASQLRRGRRADALRNETAVLDAATRVLTENSAATIPDIAAASGVARATIYRHFPTREALLGALMERAYEEIGEALTTARLEEGSAREAFERLVTEFMAVGDRYLFLLTELRRHATDSPELEHLFRRQVSALIERGQRSGELRLDVPASWAIAIVGEVIAAGLADQNAERGYGLKETVRLVVTTLIDGLGTAPV
jgi:AcrR family transcriptional regulator